MTYDIYDENDCITLLTRNAVKCLVCDTVLESKHRHHFVECNCDNQAFCDGGLDYERLGAMNLDLVENLCEYKQYTRVQHEALLEAEKDRKAVMLQKRIDNNEVVKIGGEWYSKSVIKLLVASNEKYKQILEV